MPPWTMPNSAFGIGELVEGAARPRGPAQRQLHRARGLVARRRIGRALVEDHHDVRIERALHRHRHFGRQQQPVAVDRRGERDAVLADLAQRAEAEHLEAARVGEDRPLPAHEPVQAAVRRDHLLPGPKPQVEGVAEDDLRALRDELVRRHRLDGAVGAHRHEDRRLDDAVRELEAAAPGAARRGEDLEMHRGDGAGRWCAPRRISAARRAGAARRMRARPAPARVRPAPIRRASGLGGAGRRRPTPRAHPYAGEVERVLPGAVEVAAVVDAERAERRVVRRDAELDHAGGPGDPESDGGIGFAARVGLLPVRDDDGPGFRLVAAGPLGAVQRRDLPGQRVIDRASRRRALRDCPPGVGTARPSVVFGSSVSSAPQPLPPASLRCWS